MTIARSTGALLGTSESSGVTITAGTTTTGSEVDLLGDNTSKGIIRLYVVFDRQTDSDVGLRVKVNSRRVTGQAYNTTDRGVLVYPLSSSASQKIYIGEFTISRYANVEVNAVKGGNDGGASGTITGVAVLYELEKTS